MEPWDVTSPSLAAASPLLREYRLEVPHRSAPDAGIAEPRMLEPDLFDQPMNQRLLEAAHRISSCSTTPGTASPEYALRSEQARVFEDFAEYLIDVATRPPADDALPFSRLILPPRTGKTIIAGHVIDRSGLTATVLVPTRTLVAQTMGMLSTLLPGVPIGLLTGEEKRVVEHGVNVLTHAMFRRCYETNTLPHAIGRAALVFLDEAHHAMTPGFMTALRRSFDHEALRIALTATPDYSDDRRLEHAFPDLIHQLSLAEALELELLAPLRVWVAEVDADGSKVSFVAGDFDAQVMGRLMSSAPFFSAVSVFRYGYGNAMIPALIACHTRRQASDLLEFLRAHRPAGTPEPRLILSETPRLEREESLARFERGEVDTLIQVGVLIEGWSSPRCKLLIDLAPSLSRVRSTQKYFRVMTRDGGREARIFLLLPRDLPYTPVLPMELFGTPGLEYECGTLIAPRPGSDAASARVERLERMPVSGVALKKRILLTARAEKPTLDPRLIPEIRRVLRSCPEFDPRRPCRFARFRWLIFHHRSFTGRGDFLLRYLGYPARREGYFAFLARVLPETAGEAWLEEHLESGVERTSRDDARRLARAVLEPSESSPAPRQPVRRRNMLGAPVPSPSERREPSKEASSPKRPRLSRPSEPYASTWRAARGAPLEPVMTPEELLLELEAQRVALGLIEMLKPRVREVLTSIFGICGQPERSAVELAVDQNVCRARLHQIVARGIADLRAYYRSHYLDQAERAGEGLHRDPSCHSRVLMVRSGNASRHKRNPVWGFLYEGATRQVREIPPSTYVCSCGHRLTFSPRALRALKRQSWGGRQSASDRSGHTFVFYLGELVEVGCGG